MKRLGIHIYCYVITVLAVMAHAAAPTGAVLKIDQIQGGVWAPMPATITLTDLRPADTTFRGSNGKDERGSPLFSAEARQQGATFYACDTIFGFPERSGGPTINRKGASSFIAIKETAGQPRKIWINASVGAWRISGATISDWEYQVRYFSGNSSNILPIATIGVIPNSGVYGGTTVGKVDVTLLEPERPDLSGEIGDRILFPSGFGAGEVGTVSVLVTNRGPASAQGNLEITWGILTAPSTGIFIPLRVQSISNFKLDSGASTNLSQTIKIPSLNLPDGWIFQAQIDSANQFEETDENNNLANSVSPGPDLIIAIEQLTYIRPLQPGGKLMVSLSLGNKGSKRISGDVQYRLYLEEDRGIGQLVTQWEKIYIQPAVTLQPDDKQIVTQEITLAKDLPPGLYHLRAGIDPNDLIQESREDNNNGVSELINIEGIDLRADLKVNTADFAEVNLPDQSRTMIARFVNESSGRFDRNVQYSVYLSSSKTLDAANDLPIVKLATAALALESKQSLELPLTFTLPAGSTPPLDRSGPRFLHFEIKQDPLAPETNETNNVATGPEFLMGYQVINVVTHGFNPARNINWSSFRANWYSMAAAFENMPTSGSFLAGRVKSYAPEWESGAGFFEAFGSLFAAKIAEAASKTADSNQDTARATDLYNKYLFLKDKAKSFSENSRNLFNAAADQITGHLLGPGFLQPPEISRRFQIIHLVGHSRGAALNAEVSRRLARLHYQIDQYTALDGFATDWPDDASILGDGSINDAKAQRLVSYRVETPLNKYVVDKITLSDPDQQAMLDGVVGALGSLVKPLEIAGYIFPIFDKFSKAADKINAIIPEAETRVHLLELDLRAPVRGNNFENKMFSWGDKKSHHLNITEFYLNKDGLFPSQEIYDNYLGQHRADLRPPPVDLRQFRAQLLAEGGTDATPLPPLPENPLLDFRDGSFTEAYNLRHRAIEVAKRPSGNDFIDAWLTASVSLETQLEPLWNISGNVKYGELGDNGFVTLTSAATEGSLSQWVDLGTGGRTISFDIESAPPGTQSRLSIQWNGNDFIEVPIPLAANHTPISIPLPGLTGIGELGIKYQGNSAAPLTMIVDNLKIHYSQLRFETGGILPNGSLRLKVGAGTPGEFGIETSSDLVSWQLLKIVTIGNDSSTIEVPKSDGDTQKFIRIRRSR